MNLTSDPLVMNGVVRGITFNEKKNQSMLHIQAMTVPLNTRNKILSFVYNIFNEREVRAAASSAGR